MLTGQKTMLGKRVRANGDTRKEGDADERSLASVSTLTSFPGVVHRPARQLSLSTRQRRMRRTVLERRAERNPARLCRRVASGRTD